MSTKPAKTLAFSPRTLDLKEFEELGKAAKGAGFTHLFISELAEPSDFQGEEKDSPWCEWSRILPAIFKHVTPPGLEDAYPKKNVKAQMDFMKAKHKICEKLGMKAAYYGTEPHWLHERVYRKHPQWRGSRVDNSLRATGLYFAPNTDHPEIRAAYRAGVKMISEQCPLLDFYSFNTNDSGGFYPWEKRLFSGINGPTGGLGKDMGNRVVDFLMELRNGGLDAGVDAHIFTNVYGWFVDDELHLVLRSMKPGVGVNGRCPGEYEAECSMASIGGSNWIPSPMINKQGAVIDGINGAMTAKSSKALRHIGGGNSTEYFEAFKIASKLDVPKNTREHIAVRHKVASEIYGAEVADDVVDAWQTNERAQQMTSTAGAGLYNTGIMMRYLTRPLLAHQELLTEDELSYWAPNIYQSKKAHPETWLDYLNQSGYNFVYNWEQATTICCALDGVEATYKSAADLFFRAAGKVKDKKIKQSLEMEGYRSLVLRSLAISVRSFYQVGTLIYLRDKENAENPKTTVVSTLDWPHMPKGTMGSNGLWYMHRALRWELDNVYELLDVLKKAPEPIFFTAPTPGFTGSLILEKDYIKNIERKAELMLKYWRTTEIGWYMPTLGG